MSLPDSIGIGPVSQRPPLAAAGVQWLDNTVNPIVLYVSTGTGWTQVNPASSASTPNYTYLDSVEGFNTLSTTGVMMGLSNDAVPKLAPFTPKGSGIVHVVVAAWMASDTAGDGGNIKIRYGTGVAPVFGVAPVGTIAGNTSQALNNSANGGIILVCQAVITGLVVGTTYWFDLQFAAVIGGTFSNNELTILAREL